MDAGTGLVHTAPGHGEDDFLTGQREGLPVLSPVDDGGPLHDGREVQGQEGPRRESGDRRGPAKPPARSSALDAKFRHEYPHCWRCKNPVIFRATVQWFVRLDLPTTDVRAGRPRRDREGAVDARLGRAAHRRHGREPARVGHLPPAPLGLADHRCCTPCGTASARARIPGATRRPSRRSSSTASRASSTPRAPTPGTRGPRSTSCRPDADLRGFAPGDFQDETDIMDVWFDSGVSHMAVLRSGEWPELRPSRRAAARQPLHRGPRPAPRLVPVVAADLGRALRRRALRRRHHARLRRRTDRAARCPSRSATSSRRRTSSRSTAPTSCASGSRASTTATTMPISEEILARCAEAYRKVRNTARYLISNLYDFDPAKDAVPASELEPLDRLGPGARPAPSPRRIRKAYESYEFHVDLPPARELLRDHALGFLLRHPQGPPLRLRGRNRRERRSAQTALYWIARALSTAVGPRPRLHGRGDLGGPSGKEGRIRPPRAFRAAGRPRRRHGRRRRLGALDQAARRGRRDPGRSAQRESHRLLPRGRHRPDRPARRARGATGPRPERPGPAWPISSSCPRPSRARPRPADGWRDSQAYPGLQLAFRKARGRRCDRCWKVTPEAEARASATAAAASSAEAAAA